jgi:superfamily II DNA helicase RecQ
MPYRFFVIPFDAEAQVFQEGDFRAFIEKVEVRHIQSAFFQQGSSAYWTAFVSYTGKAEQVTKPVHLNDKQLKIYQALREWRNYQAAEEGIPPYVIARNKQLEQLCTLDQPNLEQIQNIRGFGEVKVKKYGEALLALLHEKQPNLPS